VRGRNFSAHSRAHSRPSLAARGLFLRAFGGQAIFVALALLGSGSYMLGEQFADPVQAYEAGLLFAAVLIAAAVSLLYCLLHPARRTRHLIIIRPKPMSPWKERGLASTQRRALAWHENSEDPSPHHRYVDRTRIRL
jgi:hypothetical protein